ncbi:MAG: rRNA maturation RNase YbeY [Desulfobacteraceae bacterium]|jgi:rRNA maturation RNase YbeY|nr:rRNA maturation RNase YbeY [Desulfobacteraceae bacterium]
MEIQINSQREIPGLKIQKIKRKLERVLRDLVCHDKELSILFTDDKQIAELNNRYLQRKGPTNVLAFPMAGGPMPRVESVMLGDVAISIDTALRESKESGETLEYTIDRLLIHGVLHLMGYDHEKSAGEARRMDLEEERLMEVIREV